MKGVFMAVGAVLALLLTSGTASAIPLAPNAAAPVGLERFDGAVETVHYTHRRVRRHAYRPYARPYYRHRPVVTFGSPFVTPYYPYAYPYAYAPYYPYYGYPYGYAPSFGFGFHIGR